MLCRWFAEPRRRKVIIVHAKGLAGSQALSGQAAKLGCNTGLQRSLCPSLHLSRTTRPARSGAAFSSSTPPA